MTRWSTWKAATAGDSCSSGRPSVSVCAQTAQPGHVKERPPGISSCPPVFPQAVHRSSPWRAESSRRPSRRPTPVTPCQFRGRCPQRGSLRCGRPTSTVRTMSAPPEKLTPSRPVRDRSAMQRPAARRRTRWCCARARDSAWLTGCQAWAPPAGGGRLGRRPGGGKRQPCTSPPAQWRNSSSQGRSRNAMRSCSSIWTATNSRTACQARRTGPSVAVTTAGSRPAGLGTSGGSDGHRGVLPARHPRHRVIRTDAGGQELLVPRLAAATRVPCRERTPDQREGRPRKGRAPPAPADLTAARLGNCPPQRAEASLEHRAPRVIQNV